ncbi:MAG: ABC transporter permease [Sphaerochaetaceae bacterium]
MLRDALIIYRKELRNLLKDRRTLASTFLLPMLIIPIVFIGMGTALRSLGEDARQEVYQVSIQGSPDAEFVEILSSLLSFETVPSTENPDIAVVFPNTYAPGIKADIQLIYDSSLQKTQYAAAQAAKAVSEYNDHLADSLLALHGLSRQALSTLHLVEVDTASEAVQSGSSFLAMMVPYFLIMFLFSGSMGAALDTSAGEKERGSLAALLVNQVSRTSIAWGKILYVMTVSTGSSLATFAGLVISFSLPGGNVFSAGSPIGSQALDMTSLLIILPCLLCTALFTASLVTLLGCLAKTVKEGSSYAMPVYLLVVFIGVVTMQMDVSEKVLLFIVPYVNTVFTMKEAFMGNSSLLHILLMVVSDLLYAGLCGYLVSRLFNSERILVTV